MQDVVGYEIDVNDLFNSPAKTEDVQKNDNNNTNDKQYSRISKFGRGKMQEVVGYEININDLFNSPPKTEDVHNNSNNIISVEYDNPAPEGNDKKGIEFSRLTVFLKKYYRILLALILILVLIQIEITLLVVLLHHGNSEVSSTTTTTKIPTTRIATHNFEKTSTSPEETTATSSTNLKTTPDPGDTSCGTRRPYTFLFAYSNDLSSETVLDSRNQFLLNNGITKFSWYGSVRFDTENMDIQVYPNIDNFRATIQNNLPDPNQGFQNSSIGSNVFDAIEKFFSNTEAPVCGSIIYILLKRYPNEADNSRLVSLIRYHHSIVHVVTSATPSGGSQPKTMYSVASKTNGMGAFESDQNFIRATFWLPFYFTPDPIYAITIQVSGSGTIILPDFFRPLTGTYEIVITYQDHVPDNSFRNFILHYVNPYQSGNFSVDSESVSSYWHGNLVRQGMVTQEVNTKMSLDYNYSGWGVHSLQIRILTDIASQPIETCHKQQEFVYSKKPQRMI
ncbi:hypothetical protein B9Z55_003391 [Caenorhabditis nigoni]|uniref:DUF7154 domain-containing protein n=1 Tax=Caenorhabditis nigoni TaxID=1611254 RepID=A0A2G5VQ00_9PELO|nr:hypothetical protein B9Z55_003391 [Caenorhabditis nigoni]